MMPVMLQLTHMMTWTTISPVLALSYFSRLYPPHPLTQQFAVRVLRSFTSVSIMNATSDKTKRVAKGQLGHSELLIRYQQKVQSKSFN